MGGHFLVDFETLCCVVLVDLNPFFSGGNVQKRLWYEVSFFSRTTAIALIAAAKKRGREI